MERFLQRPLQWNVCLFHFNELPLKTLVTHMHGKQVGPGIWPGEFGSELLSCEQSHVSVTEGVYVRSNLMPFLFF